MTRLRKVKTGGRGAAPAGANKCSLTPLLPKYYGTPKEETSDGQCPNLSDVIGHPGIKGALDLLDDGPPSWAWWRAALEECKFVKEARELEALDDGTNDTVIRFGLPTGLWASGPDSLTNIDESTSRRWPMYILAGLRRSRAAKKAPSQAVPGVLPKDEVKRTPTTSHARGESSSSSTESDSSAPVSEGSSNVWTHLVREEDDDDEGFSGLMGDGLEGGEKPVSKEPRTSDA